MKKFLIVAIVICMMIPCALSEDIDLSALSFEQLVALKERINLALFSSDEWQEVVVPQGIWLVGKDIPAGKWTLTAQQTDDGITYIQYGSKLNDNKNEIEYKYMREYFWISSKVHKRLKSNDITEYTIELREGDYFIVDPSYGPVVFHPYTDEPSFTFK